MSKNNDNLLENNNEERIDNELGSRNNDNKNFSIENENTVESKM